jgi:hypothetical protein
LCRSKQACCVSAVVIVLIVFEETCNPVKNNLRYNITI